MDLDLGDLLVFGVHNDSQSLRIQRTGRRVGRL